jgi:hypothetical protein
MTPIAESVALPPGRRCACGFRLWPGLVVLTVGVLLASGCKPRDAIRHYRAPKAGATESPDRSRNATAREAGRMLAAVIPQGERAWFFKLTGPEAAVAPHADAFRRLLRSLEFVDGKPQWKLPAGWREVPGGEMRFATLEIGPPEQALRLTVTPLGRPDGELSEYVLSNVNLWRSQMSLPPITGDKLDAETERIEFPGGTATMVDLAGQLAVRGMGGSSPHGTLRPGGGPAAPASSDVQPAQDSAVSYQTPTGWKPGSLTVSRGGVTLRHEAAFDVTDGARRVEVTVDRLPGPLNLLQNINRWRGQVKLGPMEEKDLQQLGKITVGDQSADFVELVGPAQTILGAIWVRGGETWYVKLLGDPELAQREKDNFQGFVKSLKSR